MKLKPELLEFLRNQRLFTIATVDENGDPWISNVYASVSDLGDIFFVSPTDTKHSQHIKNHSRVAVSTAWYSPTDFGDRKAIQVVGGCSLIKDPLTIAKFLTNHYIYYPLWKDVITEESMRKKIISSRPYVIRPISIKFWNDALFGDEGVEEYEI